MSTTDTPIKIKQVNPIVADNIDDMADIKALVAFFDKTTEVRDVNGTVVNEKNVGKYLKDWIVFVNALNVHSMQFMENGKWNKKIIYK